MQEEADPLDVYRSNHTLEPRDASHWTFRIGPWEICLPNFAWRQAAIDAHDRHHMLTGYRSLCAVKSRWRHGNGVRADTPTGAPPPFVRH